ncbi:MAG: helix-turn-helix domain-containing protein [Butyrivibrio sp.]|uniref:AraC family transcriptional regulator n=1 Tax=Butyrivibrio sp. TaxID=28121 RepID=UPI0025BCB444|nr:AraC family transcriptional regulator [Butyrivibrio sp.]MBQ6589799.1 helix-turn-helix domain-containing protein [Butyrivibrio sp.]
MNNAEKETINFDGLSEISITDEETPEYYPAHWHNAMEFTIALKSGCKYRINGISYELKEGDVLLAWPQQIHETLFVPPKGAIFTQFSASIFENNMDLVSIARYLYDCHYFSNEEYPELTRFISDKVFEIRNIRISGNPLAETRCKICIYEILLKIGEFVLNDKKEEIEKTHASGSAWRYIHLACDYIIDNSTENITQAEVASRIGLSSYYLSKLFKSYMNMSFPAYLSNIRVRNAAKLLADDNLSITECAFQAGFQSTTAFNKAFHDITGYSPREYRKLCR